ncbi:SurA N-terminal domain-containing protein [Planococcus lenghuensis]|uniref:Peptidylprolyl isomerase n=1 Tax=Planococcus lenghuensis TaxID=2213202 RepID=A0A1Q2KYY1_9BACL|nr:SurA N-terminal domain-containing protein [Planococcus lenghuensis]AQQ53334.1 peptidylprolyl isomerase [Planococcus lenghuensis]
MKKKLLLNLALGGSVALLAACGGTEETAEETEEVVAEEEVTEEAVEEEAEVTEEPAEEGAEEAVEPPAIPEPDLEAIPDVVAVVNGEEITKDEFVTIYTTQFQQAAMQAQLSGQEVDEAQLQQQLVDSLIGQELLIQEAANQDLTASQEEIDATLAEFAEQNGLASTEEFLAALEEQGVSAEEVTSQVETQVKVEKLITAETGEFTPTEAELEELYAQLEEQQAQTGGGELPPFEEIRPALEDQLIVQKEREATQTLVDDLRETAEVTVNL